MQMVEEGELDLDEDVNAYLGDVEIPDTYPGRPVTLRHLLTHTAGFEQTFTGSGAYGEPGGEPGRHEKATRLARPLAWAACALALLFVAGMALVFSNPEGALFFGDSPLLVAVLALPYLLAALVVGVIFYAALSWKRRYWGLFGRLHYSLVALAALAFVGLLGYYNLLGFQF